MIRRWMLTLVFLGITTYSLAQTRHVTGEVTNLNGEPVSFASVRIGGGTKGTLTDERGVFDLKIKGSDEQILIVTAVGYNTRRIEIKDKLKNIPVILEPDVKLLNTVFVFSDSLLKVLLEKSFKKIADNYPQNPIELTGLYRSYRQLEKGMDYLQFTEASLKIQEGGYQISHEDAQVEVLKLRNVEFPNLDRVDNVWYYGGSFIADWNDPVKMREPFLNPRSFNKRFAYHLESIQNNHNGRDYVYVVRFMSRDKNESKTGEIWIDKKTFAYRRIVWQDEDPQMFNPLIPIKRLVRNYETVYESNGSVNFLKYSSLKGENYNNKTKNKSHFTLEFVTTAYELEGDHQPIPLEKRLKYGALFSELKSSRDHQFENEYLRIESDSALVQKWNVIRIDSNILDNKSKINGIKKDFRNWIRLGLDRVHFSYGLGNAFYNKMTSKHFEIGNGVQQIRNVPGASVAYSCISLGFRLNLYGEIRLNFNNQLLNANLYKVTAIDYYHCQMVKKRGNPLFLTASIGISKARTGILIAEPSKEKPMTIDGQNYGKNSTIYLGEKVIGVQLGLGLEYRKKRLSYFGEIRYTPNIRINDILLLKQRRNFFYTKTVETGYPANDISINPRNIYHGIFPITLFFGIRLAM